MVAKSLEQKVTDLQKTVQSCQHEIERLQAVNEIENLMSKYEYLHMTNRHEEVMEMYSQKAPDVRVTMKEMGYWQGHDAPQRAWGDLVKSIGKNATGMLAIHPTTTPMIVVAGDGKTAKGVWIGTGFVAGADPKTKEPHCGWEWDRYGVDFIKEDGKWKFWHFHVYTLFTTGWDDPWAKQFTRESPKMHFYFEPDGPPVDSYPYRPDTVVQLIPLPPEPFETWDKTFSY